MSSTCRRQAHLVYESLLERDRFLLADFCPAVEWMAAQPFWMRGYDGPTFRCHVPDLLLQHRNGAFTVVDVKPELANCAASASSSISACWLAFGTVNVLI